jgi:hypothetical protein
MDFRIDITGPDWKKLEREVIRQANEEARRRASAALAGFRCPDHGKPMTFVRAQGSLGDLQDLGRIEGCCEKAMELAQERIDRSLS